ncbi:MAG: SDR family oxidoreductase [Candidatus Omnitrophica bacterium]|nr:SDR family oxidoreductase [Candidatus Omnitrophota bacterium]
MTIFLTGSTGQIGSYLVKVLLDNGHKVFALARTSSDGSARERFVKAVSFWDDKVLKKNKNNFFVFDGDVTKKNLKLKKHEIDVIKKEVDCLVHSAANIDPMLDLQDARRINLYGTRNILELNVDLSTRRKPKKLYHISTAYICGNYDGVFSEDSFDVGQKFNTTYEQTKFEGEKLVREYREKGLAVDILRPGLVMGETITGKINRFLNIYHLLHICKNEVFGLWPLKDAFVSIVPVDCAVFAIYKILIADKLDNMTYNIFPNKSVKMGDIIKWGSKYFRFKMPGLISVEEFLKTQTTPVQKMLFQKTAKILNTKVKLDSKRTNLFLKKNNFNYPDIDEKYFSDIFKYCVERGFMKK